MEGGKSSHGLTPQGTHSITYDHMAEEFSTKKDGELKSALAEKQEALRLFRFGVAGSKSRTVREGRTLRRTIARLKTELNRRIAVGAA